MANGVPLDVKASGTSVRVVLPGAPPMALREGELRRLSKRIHCRVPKTDVEAAAFAMALRKAQEQVRVPHLKLGSQNAGKPRPSQSSYRFKGHLHPLDRERERLRRIGAMKSELKGVSLEKSEERKEWPSKSELAAAAAKQGISCSGWNPDKGELKFECSKQRHTYTGEDTAWFSKAVDEVLKEFHLKASEIQDAESTGA